MTEEIQYLYSKLCAFDHSFLALIALLSYLTSLLVPLPSFPYPSLPSPSSLPTTIYCYPVCTLGTASAHQTPYLKPPQGVLEFDFCLPHIPLLWSIVQCDSRAQAQSKGIWNLSNFACFSTLHLGVVLLIC